jgi:Rieske 2Fe-2S family protein
MTATATVAGQVLDPAAYWSAEWYEREQTELFARCWNLVGTVDDVAAGGVLHATVAGRAVVLGRDGPWWGRTVRGGAPVAVEVWAGMVFVHLDPGAELLRGWLHDFPEHIGGYRPEELVEIARVRFDVAANWKLFVENHVDVYHLWYLHERSLADYDHPRAAYRFCGPHWVFYEPPRDGPMARAELVQQGMRVIAHIDESWYGSGAHLIFPNVPIASGATFFQTYQAIPRGPERTTIDLRIRAEPGSDPTAFVPLTRTVLEVEDGLACERMQAGLRSPRYAVGPLARSHELPIHRFQADVLATMAGAEPAPA